MQLSLLLVLGICCVCLRAAPQTEKSGSPEQLVRVYRINEEQYERMLKLTEGKNVISEARLISGGFATVSESLSSGWHSLLRIVGLTTISKADEAAKLDIDGQPLCVIKTREGEARGESSARSAGKAYDDDGEDEPIHCIVVLKNGQEDEQELPEVEYYSGFNNYWSVPQTAEISPSQEIIEPAKAEMVQEAEKPSEVKMEEKQEQEEEEKQEQEEITTEPQPKPKLNKKKRKYNQSRTNAKSQTSNDSSSRQYVPSYPYTQYPPTSPYGSYNPYGPPSPPLPPYGGQLPYNPYNPSPVGPYGPQSYYGQPYPYGQSFPYGQPPPYPYGPYGYYDQNQAAQSTDGRDNVDNLEDDSSYELVEPEIEYQTEVDNYWGYDNE